VDNPPPQKKKSAKSQLVENSSCKFEPPWRRRVISANTIGCGEEALQKICDALRIRQGIAY
jgi:hypothetical protein